MLPPDKLYRFHVENLRTVTAALDKVARTCREAISRGDSQQTSAFLRLTALLLGTWAECRLRKLMYEPNGFEEAERKLIRQQPTQLERWHSTLEIAFRKRYGVKKSPLVPPAVPHSAAGRFMALTMMLDNDLRSIIELRNKLAHGQWIYLFTNDELSIAQPQMDLLRQETVLSLKLKQHLLGGLSDIVHDLVVSKPTFERDFDDHFRAIEQNRINLKTRSYDKYQQGLRARFLRGKQARNQNWTRMKHP